MSPDSLRCLAYRELFISLFSISIARGLAIGGELNNQLGATMENLTDLEILQNVCSMFISFIYSRVCFLLTLIKYQHTVKCNV